MKVYDSVLDWMKDSLLVRIPPRALKGRAPLPSAPGEAGGRADGAPAGGGHAPLWAQLELALPGAMKDRPALEIIERAEACGLLRPGGTIIESSSGTMAEGLARAGRLKGYRVIIVTDPRIDTLTAAKLRALGAELEVVSDYDPQGGWQSSRLRRLREVQEALPGAFWSQQYDSPGNAGAYRRLGEELAGALGGRIGALVAAVGSGGSLCGLARALRERAPGVRIVAVDAVGSALFNQPDRKRLQSGHGNSIMPGNLEHSVIDEVHWIADGEAFNGCRELAAQAGIFAGGSSGAVYVVASWVARCLPATTNVVAVLPDRGDRYHLTVYADEFLAEHGLTGQLAGDAPVPIAYGQEEARRWSYATLPRDGSVPYYREDVQLTADLSHALGLRGSSDP